MPGSMFKKPLGMNGLFLGCGSVAWSQELGYAFLDHLVGMEGCTAATGLSFHICKDPNSLAIG